jgi:hypothetical protein
VDLIPPSLVIPYSSSNLFEVVVLTVCDHLVAVCSDPHPFCNVGPHTQISVWCLTSMSLSCWIQHSSKLSTKGPWEVRANASLPITKGIKCSQGSKPQPCLSPLPQHVCILRRVLSLWKQLHGNHLNVFVYFWVSAGYNLFFCIITYKVVSNRCK